MHLPGLDPLATPLVGIGLGLTGLALGLRPRLAGLPFALTLATALLLRDPERATPAEPNAIFAPADGYVQVVDELYEHCFLHTDAVRVTIASSILHVATQRSPAAGRIVYRELVANDQAIGWVGEDVRLRGITLLLGIDAGWAPILLAIDAAPIAGAPVERVGLGDVVAAGDRLAVARFGAHISLLIPADLVAGLPTVGEHVQAGRTRFGHVVVR
jgi:phosphatidylserine decarboxylase